MDSLFILTKLGVFFAKFTSLSIPNRRIAIRRPMFSGLRGPSRWPGPRRGFSIERCLIKQIFHLFSQQFVTGQTVHQYGELDPIQFVVHHFTTSNYLLALENQKVLIIDNTKSYGASIQLLPIPVIGRTVSRSAAIATPKYQQPCGPGPAEKMPTKWPFLQNCISSSHCTWDGCAALQEIRTHKIHAQCNTNHIQN